MVQLSIANLGGGFRVTIVNVFHGRSALRARYRLTRLPRDPQS